jgi:catechol 2,3-dioxygenase-like lactoylglutathione lyase family enzyme
MTESVPKFASAPKLDGINLVVADMDASVAFYRLLGLEIADTEPQWQHQHRNVTTGNDFSFDLDSVEFAREWNQGWTGGSGGHTGVLGFRVDSRDAVDELFARVAGAGYRAQQSPYDAFWGARYAVVEDPDGNAVGLMSPIDPDRRGA